MTTISLESIQNVIWQLRTDSAQYAVKQRNYLCYDGAYCKPEVTGHLKALEMIRNQYLANTLCICPEEVSSIYYGATKYLGHLCAAPTPDYLKADRPDKALWVLQNPDCVLYDYWVDYLKSQCKKIGINFAVKVKECSSIGLDIKVAYQQICDTVVLDLLVKEIKCDFDIDITVKELDQCKVDFDLYVKPLNCDISLGLYAKALSCGISLDTIVKEIKCGACLCLTADGVDFCYPETEGDVVIIPLEFDLVVDDLTICYYTDMEVRLENVTNPYADYQWDFGSGAVPSTATGVGPHIIQYTTAGTKTITVTATAADLTTVKTLTPVISTCLGSITGTVNNELGVGIGTVNVRLYHDTNADGISDGGASVKSILSSNSGVWSMTSVIPGNYVLVITLPGGYHIVSASDSTPDGDIAPDISGTDITIPVTIHPGTNDANNNFVISNI